MRYLTPLDYALINVRPNCAEYLAKQNALPGIIYAGIMVNRVRLAWRRYRRRKYGRWVKCELFCFICSVVTFLFLVFYRAVFFLRDVNMRCLIVSGLSRTWAEYLETLHDSLLLL